MKLTLELIFSKQWWWTTLLVLAAMATMIRLGIWQLDRLEQRRAFNARVNAQIDQPVLELEGDALATDLEEMEYRAVKVEGIYDHSQEVALRNQVWAGRPGVHLITPLRIAESDQLVLVDRGWIPVEDFREGDWTTYEEPGVVVVKGLIRRSQERSDIGGRTDPTLQPGEGKLSAWNFVNVVRISNQMRGSFLPIYIQQSPDPERTGLPYRDQPDLDLSEGPHLGYAGQWFLFAAVLGIGYPIYLGRQIKNTRSWRESHEGIT